MNEINMKAELAAASAFIVCDNCGEKFSKIDPTGKLRDKCPKCERAVIPADLIAAQADMEQSYEARGFNDSLAVVRPLITAVIETVLEAAPQFPRVMLTSNLKEDGVFRFLVELEKKGFRIIPVKPGGTLAG